MDLTSSFLQLFGAHHEYVYSTFSVVIFRHLKAQDATVVESIFIQAGLGWWRLLMVLHMPGSCKWEIWEDNIKIIFNGTGDFKSMVNFFCIKKPNRNRSLPFQNLSGPEVFIPHFWVNCLLNIFCPVLLLLKVSRRLRQDGARLAWSKSFWTEDLRFLTV